MTKTLLALVLIAGGILPVTRLVDTEKSVPARLSPPTGADQKFRKLGACRRLCQPATLQSHRSLAEVLLFEAEYYGCRS